MAVPVVTDIAEMYRAVDRLPRRETREIVLQLLFKLCAILLERESGVVSHLATRVLAQHRHGGEVGERRGDGVEVDADLMPRALRRRLLEVTIHRSSEQVFLARLRGRARVVSVPM